MSMTIGICYDSIINPELYLCGVTEPACTDAVVCIAAQAMADLPGGRNTYTGGIHIPANDHLPTLIQGLIAIPLGFRL